MHKKKQILFIMNNLQVGGAEKALVSLLQVFNYDLYDVDLFLFKREGSFLKQVPAAVHILPVPENYIYFDGPIVNAVFQNLRKFNLGLIIDRILFGFLQKKEIPAAEKEQRSWKYKRNHLPYLKNEYDVAIGFLENTPNYFCIDKVIAKKKIGFIQNDYEHMRMKKEIDDEYFKKLDFIVSNSSSSSSILKAKFPQFSQKIHTVENITPKHLLLAFANDINEPIQYRSENLLVSVGRLVPQKGFDLAVNAAHFLKEEGVDFLWLIIGYGEKKEELQTLINELKLDAHIKLLGLKENPYPYISLAKIYIQPSRFEGKSVVVDEAKILAKPIILTNFPTARDQVKNGENGLIVEINARSLADGIAFLLKSDKMRHEFSENLNREIVVFEHQLQKFCQLIES